MAARAPKRREKGKLRKLLFKNRANIKALEKEGVSRGELRAAVKALHDDGEFPKGEDPGMLAALIVAELMDNPSVQVPRAANWDKIFELIEKLMPFIQAFMSGCGL